MFTNVHLELQCSPMFIFNIIHVVIIITCSRTRWECIGRLWAAAPENRFPHFASRTLALPRSPSECHWCLLLLWLWLKWNWSKKSPFEACQPQDWSWPGLSPKQPDAPHIWRERVNNCFSVFLWILFICSRKSLTWRRFPPSEEPFLQGPQPYDILVFCPHFDGSDIDNHHSGQNFDFY